MTSIPVSEFIDPPRKSRAWNAVDRAISIRPDVRPIGQIPQDGEPLGKCERYYRVQAKKRDRHVVTLWDDEMSGEPLGKCDCESHVIPQEPQHCYHIAAALIWESQREVIQFPEKKSHETKRTPRKEGSVQTNRRS